MSVREAISWVKDLHYECIQVKIDALQVFYEIQDDTYHFSTSLIIDDVKQVMGTLLILLSLLLNGLQTVLLTFLIEKLATYLPCCVAWFPLPKISL